MKLSCLFFVCNDYWTRISIIIYLSHTKVPMVLNLKYCTFAYYFRGTGSEYMNAHCYL